MTAGAAGGRPEPARPGPPPALLTVSEVAAALRVSKMTVYRLIHSGELPALLVRRSFRVRMTDFVEHLLQPEGPGDRPPAEP